MEEGQGKGEIRFEGGNGLQKEYYLFSKFLKSSVLRKVAVSLRPQIVSESSQEISRIRNVRMTSRAWKMAQLPPLFQFSVKENKFSLEREDTFRKFFGVNFPIDSINEIGFGLLHKIIYEQY